MKHLYRQKYNDDRAPGTASRYWCENNTPLGESDSTRQISQVNCVACLDAYIAALQARARSRFGHDLVVVTYQRVASIEGVDPFKGALDLHINNNTNNTWRILANIRASIERRPVR